MSRHRNVRNMDYSEDYDGYDDVYGHSVEEDYYISPSNRQFIYNRENSRNQPKIGEFIQTEHDIQEEDESDLAVELSDVDKAKLESCLEQINLTIDPLNTPKNELTHLIISNKFDIEKTINAILDDSKTAQAEPKMKGVTNSSTPKFVVPKLNSFKTKTEQSSNFVIPKLSIGKDSRKNFTIPKIGFPQSQSDSSKFSNLSELVSNHLCKSLKGNLKISNDSGSSVSKITESVEELKISKPGFNVDLSVALRSTPSGRSLSNKSKSVEKETEFHIPFVDCISDRKSFKILKCSFDVEDIFKISLVGLKAPSNFGKVLCRKYRKRLLKIKREDDAVWGAIPRFNFSTPSPDDNILKHLNRVQRT